MEKAKKSKRESGKSPLSRWLLWLSKNNFFKNLSKIACQEGD